MTKPNHPIVAGFFIVLTLPLLVLGIIVAFVWRFIEAGFDAFDKFMKWI